ncbi:MAG: BamA/TamA family outer membrane protein [Muribaculaceae bacterium]|nr:BamA/TamA family outer membrane protein [Muribaculaceae bacterium]
MIKRIKIAILILMVAISGKMFCVYAQEENPNFVRRVINYFGEANKPHPDKKFDISFIGAPFYSSEAGLGLGLVSSARYYTHRDAMGVPMIDTPPSQLSLKGKVTLGQLYKIEGEGYHIFPKDRFRINYSAYVYTFKDKFWGIGYEMDKNDNNESIFKRIQGVVKADFVMRFGKRFFIGPIASFSYNKATRVDRPELFAGEPRETLTTGVGITAYYDSRDVPFNAYRGIFLRYNQVFNPRFMGNKYAFSQSELTASVYKKVWKSGVLAAMYHADITYGNTPWGMLPTFGGSERMRGYYEGRFRDKCEMDITVELRQHIWRRNGIVVWIGAGTIFPKFSDFDIHHVLPNAGVGYRWEFKQRVNVRLDFGIGKDEYGFNFSINEAF